MTETYAVVFQMGKVASTAITTALDQLPGVTAVQSHFLGSVALGQVLNLAIQPTTQEYFFGHQVGQLTQNIACTRHINRINAGVDPRKLVVLSLTRDPFTWFRSSIVQDIEGYADLFEEMGQDGPPALRAPKIGRGLTRFLGMAADRLSAHGSLDAFQAGLRTNTPGAWDSIADLSDDKRRLLLVALRPATWFDQHFTGGLGVELHQLAHHGQVWRHQDGQAHYGIIRYEDVTTAFPEFCDWALGQTPALAVQNSSQSKPLADVIAAAFDTEEGARLKAALSTSDYARRFGYA